MISIIMPVYNSEKYVSEAIESVCNQSYNHWELLIVNDGSTDHTSKIIDDYSKKDSRIKIFHRNNEGVSTARNFALSQICGEYVTFIDSDDVYHRDRLERMLQVFEQYTNCDIVFSRHKEFKGRLNKDESIGSEKVVLSDDDILEKVISDSRCHFMCNTMMKAEIAKKEKFAPIRFAEDFCYIRDCACHCSQMAILDEVLYFYRRDNENAMTSHFFSEKYVPDYMKLVENIYKFCKNHKLENDFYKRMVAREYAQNSMRIRKSSSYSKFVACMNDKKFREGMGFADASQCTLFERVLFCMVKYKIYFPFAFWIW
ncbi:glycosyltransferase family 2 protein [Sporofaciens sp. SGI.106]|uniref:glycosyltransferase family 2 protein n=1 Tax=Sporofaciens sp. SGI.106 TaxID=3420568 RepID=UPI003CFE3EB2